MAKSVGLSVLIWRFTAGERIVVDFEAFDTTRHPPAGKPDDVLLLSCDGKGIVMRPDALRPAIAKAAKNSANKLKSRLSKGEKRNRKRMAEVGAVYDLTRWPAARPGHGRQ